MGRSLTPVRHRASWLCSLVVLALLLAPGLSAGWSPNPSASTSNLSSPVSPPPLRSLAARCVGGLSCEPPVNARGPTPFAAPDAWTNVSVGQRFSPAAVVGGSVVYDPLDNYLVMFGGCSAVQCPAPAQTWKFSGGNWSVVPTGLSQPPARSYASMAYDSKDGYVVLFGGWGTGGRPLNDTWAFIGGLWTNLSTPGPAPPAGGGASMTHDHGDAYLLLFGGGVNSSAPRALTWRFVAGTWKNLTATAGTAPSPRERAGMAWDDADGYVVLFGGASASGSPLNDTWTYLRGKWAPANITSVVNPRARSGAMFTFSGVDNAVYLYGGNGSQGPLNDTWRYAGGKWGNQTTALGPGPGRRMNAVALDSSIGWAPGGTLKQKNGFLLLFGGGPAGCVPCSAAALNETWVFEPALQTLATALPSVVEVGEPTTFSATVTAGSPPYRLSWQFGDGTGSVSASPSHAFTTTGVFNATVNAVDLAGVADSATISVSVIAGPAVTASVSRLTTDVGLTVWFNSTSSGGTPPYTVHWNLGDGTSFSGASTSHSYGVAGTFNGNLTATDAVGGVGVRAFSVRVNPALTFMATLPSPSPTAGSNATFRVSLNAGTTPYSVTWSFGDGGTSSLVVATHAYHLPGNYSLHLAVRDAAGAVGQANFTVVVLGGAQTSPPTPTFLGITAAGWAVLVVVLGAAGVAIVLLRRRRPRRRPPEGPIAAAAVGAGPWELDETGEPRSDSRSARRNALRGGRR